MYRELSPIPGPGTLQPIRVKELSHRCIFLQKLFRSCVRFLPLVGGLGLLRAGCGGCARAPLGLATMGGLLKKKGVDSYVAQQLHNTFFRVIDVSLEFMLVQVSFWNLKLSFPF
ncbi:unnamed protein product, partial [Vitis vinifera]